MISSRASSDTATASARTSVGWKGRCLHKDEKSKVYLTNLKVCLLTLGNQRGGVGHLPSHLAAMLDAYISRTLPSHLAAMLDAYINEAASGGR